MDKIKAEIKKKTLESITNEVQISESKQAEQTKEDFQPSSITEIFSQLNFGGFNGKDYIEH